MWDSVSKYQLAFFLSQEQEKQRNTDKVKEEKKGLERKKEDADEVQKLQAKRKQELQRWEKECLAREKQQVRPKPYSYQILKQKKDFLHGTGIE